MRELTDRGHAAYFLEAKDLRLHNNTLYGHVAKINPDNVRGFVLEDYAWRDLSHFESIVIRKDPPFDFEYLAAMYLLDFLRPHVFMMNDPAGIRNFNEKLLPLFFPRRAPVTFAAMTDKDILRILMEHPSQTWVLKPSYDKGGNGILLLKPPYSSQQHNIESLTRAFPPPYILQAFISHQTSGDKRILVLGNQILGAFKRIPPQNDFRANLTIGATAHAATVTEQEIGIVSDFTAFLTAQGLHLVGFDVLDGYVTEINVTSPAGIPEINAFDKTKLESMVCDYLEEKIRLYPKPSRT